MDAQQEAMARKRKIVKSPWFIWGPGMATAVLIILLIFTVYRSWGRTHGTRPETSGKLDSSAKDQPSFPLPPSAVIALQTRDSVDETSAEKEFERLAEENPSKKDEIQNTLVEFRREFWAEKDLVTFAQQNSTKKDEIRKRLEHFRKDFPSGTGIRELESILKSLEDRHESSAPGMGNPEDALSPGDLFKHASPAVVRIESLDREGGRIASGSGVVVDASGTVVTNWHVVEGASNVRIQDAGGILATLDEVAAFEPNLDVAAFACKLQNHAFLKLRESSPEIGERVYAIGSPFGVLINTFSEGMISGLRKLRDDGVWWIQTTAPISPGSSGGPLIGKRPASPCLLSAANRRSSLRPDGGPERRTRCHPNRLRVRFVGATGARVTHESSSMHGSARESP